MAFTQPHQPIQSVQSAVRPRSTDWVGWGYAVLFTGLPIGVMAWVWATNAVNVPKWDDHIFKAFLLALETESSPLGWFRQVVKQHNEHRIAYDRLLAWADYSLFGKLSFKRLMIYGDLSLLALMAVLAHFTARYVKAWYLFLPPIVLFIGSLAQWENFFWALSSIQNFSIVVWSVACLYALSHNRTIWLAIGLATVATVVSGNGFLLWPIGLLVLLTQRRFRTMLPWGVAAVILIAIYFGDYVQPTTHPPTRGSLLDLAGGCLAFLGAAVEALPVSYPYQLSILLGGVLLLYWGWVTAHSVGLFLRKKPLTSLQAFGLGVLAFLVGTAVVVVWGRFGYGRESLLTSRYRIYSLTLLASTYAYWLSVYYRNRVVSPKTAWYLALSGVVSSGMLWWSAFTLNAHESIALRRLLLTNMQYNWTYTINRPVSTLDAVTRRLIDNSPAFYDATLPAFFKPGQGPAFPVDTLFKTAQGYVIRLGPNASTALPSLSQPDRGLNVLLRSAKRTYLYGALPAPRRHWRVLLHWLPLYDAKQPIDVLIPSNEIDAGTYEILVAQYSPDRPGGLVRPTHQLLTVAPHPLVTGPAKNW